MCYCADSKYVRAMPSNWPYSIELMMMSTDKETERTLAADGGLRSVSNETRPGRLPMMRGGECSTAVGYCIIAWPQVVKVRMKRTCHFAKLRTPFSSRTCRRMPEERNKGKSCSMGSFSSTSSPSRTEWIDGVTCRIDLAVSPKSPLG